MNRTDRALRSLGLLALAAGLGACARHADLPAPPSAVYVTTIGAAPLQEERVLTATVHARVETELAFRTGGKVVRRLVNVGDKVAAGQALATLDGADATLAIAAAADQVMAATVEAEQLSADEARLHRLVADGSVAATDHEQQQARAVAAAARADLARRQFELARRRDGYGTLRAPYAGVLTGLSVEVGQVVAEGQPVLSLAQDGEREVVADVPETLVREVRSFSARLRAWDRTGPIELQLREAAPIAATQTRTYRVRFAAKASAAAQLALARLPLGSTAELVLSRDSEASTSLPPSAVVKGSASTGVWALDKAGDGLRFVPVDVLRHDVDAVEVRPLAPGLRVVTVGAQKLDATLKVRPIERPPVETVAAATRLRP